MNTSLLAPGMPAMFGVRFRDRIKIFGLDCCGWLLRFVGEKLVGRVAWDAWAGGRGD
jgi:hypothetical protein